MTGAFSRGASRAIAGSLAIALPACAGTTGPIERDRAFANSPLTLTEELRVHVEALAHDSMQGRRTGAAGARRSARYIAAQLHAIGLVPLGDSGYLQRVPLGLRARMYGPAVPVGLESWRAYDSLPPSRRVVDANVIGLLPGHATSAQEGALVVAAHHDHHGVGRPLEKDSILNGADDNASGVATVLAIARVLRAGQALRRPIVFLFTTGEEFGLLGAAWYIAHPPVPLRRTSAFLGIEMTGRRDTLAGGPGRAWLTGDERSTMGATMRRAGLPIVPDPRPGQRFFERSDNFAFASAGIPAHTLSSFSLHDDYHRVSDEAATLDIDHMTAVAASATRAVRLLAESAAPTWNAGGRP